MTSDIQSLITEYASAAGVPPSLAIAVANNESRGNQYNSDGSLVVGSSGEIGIFQLMPSTAAALDVDPTDLNQNIQGGVTYLAQLYAQFGNWASAVAAYNAGASRVASGSIPLSTQSYVASVMSMAGDVFGGATTSASSPIDLTGSGSSVPLAAFIGVFGLLLLWWLVD